MRMPNKKSSSFVKKASLIILSGVVLLVAGAGIYVYGMGGELLGIQATSTQDSKDNNLDGTNSSSGNNLPDEAVETGKGKPDTSTSNGNTDTPPPDQSGILRATITAANQNGDILQIRTLIEEVVGSGACTLTLKNGTVSVTKTATIQALPSSSTCKGFDVAVSELSKGDWSITIDIVTPGKKAQLTKTITIT